jgi:alpha,alpha-trehalase
MNDWLLIYTGIDPHEEGLREALCTVGNGYFATRGAWPESTADDVHYPGTYVAGLFNRLSSDIEGRTVENESLVNVPNWLPLQIRIDDGPWISEDTAEVLDHHVELDMHRGVLTRHTLFADSGNRRLHLTQRRFVSMDNAHLAALETTLVPENFSGTLKVSSGLDGTVANTGIKRYRDLPSVHLDPIETRAVDDETVSLLVETNQSHIRIAEAARTRVYVNGERATPTPEVRQAVNHIAAVYPVEVEAGDEVIVEKVVALHTSMDSAITEPVADAIEAVTRSAHSFDELLERHAVSWRHRWQRTEIELGSNSDTALLLHLHMYHVMVTVSPHSAMRDVGMPARGLHGEAYRGHIFWDELFIFPFFSLRLPELTRALLLYRYRRLNQARLAAEEAGFQGAMYPWQSSSNGREETQTMHLNPQSGRWLPDGSHLQRHVNAAVAYNVWNFYQATGDEDFMRFYGAEMLLEIARLWASMAVYNHSLDRYEITGVMGPDEYHEGYPGREESGLDNNSYTNIMAVWCLCRGLEILSDLPPGQSADLRERLNITPQEIDLWDDISRKMRVCFHDDKHGGWVIAQFEGFDQLEELDWDAYRRRYGDIARLDRILESENDSTNRYQLSKQADVLMLFYLLSNDELGELLERLGYSYDDGLADRTVAYYEARTSHGSTLSRVVHSWIHARSQRDRSWTEFLEVLHSDIDDIQGGTTAEGVHTGAMAGAIDLVQRCYTGLELRHDELRLDPRLPDQLGSLAMGLQYRGRDLHLEFTQDTASVRVLPSRFGPVSVRCRHELKVVSPGAAAEFDLTDRTSRRAVRESGGTSTQMVCRFQARQDGRKPP